MTRAGVVLLVYVLLALASGLGAWLLRGDFLLDPEPWLSLEPLTAHVYSSVLGLTVGLLVARATPGWTSRWSFARVLRDELSPFVRGLGPRLVLWIAALSALGEELFFRALLLPVVGLGVQAVLFGLAHQLPGRARWIWVLWASMMGVVLGSLFKATGSILGPILAHAAINALNLRYMQLEETVSTPRPLGGVLGRGAELERRAFGQRT